MDISQLEQKIQAALANPPFTISGAYLESPPITALLTNVYGADTFVLSGAQQSGETADSISVTGTNTQTLIGLTNLPASAVFTVVGGVAQMHAELTGLPASWSPATAFSAVVGGSVFAQFTWSSQTLTLDSIPIPLPANYPANFGYPPYSQAMTAAMKQGLGVRATIAQLPGTGGVISYFLGGSSWTVSGPIVLPESQLSIVVSTPTQSGVSIGGFSFPFSLTLASVAAQYETDGPIVVASVLQLDAEVDRDLGDGTTFRFPVFIREGSTTAATWSIESHMPQGQGITVAQIGQLIGYPVENQIPPPDSDFPPFTGIQLSDVVMLLSSDARGATSMVSLSATITWFAPPTYSTFDGLIVFNSLAVTFTYVPSGYVREEDNSVWYVMTDTVATATISGGVLDASLALPDVYFNTVLTQPPIDLKALVVAAVGPSISMPQIDVTALTVTGDVMANEYRFQCTVTDDWVFHLGTVPLALTQMSMDITSATAGFSGEVTAMFSIAGADLFGRAAYDAPTQGWEFQLCTMGETHVNLTELITDLFAVFGVQFPANAPAMYLDALNMGYNTATAAWVFQCQGSLEICGTRVVLGVDLSNGVYKGYIWVGDSYFEANFLTTNNQNVLSASWTATTEQAYLNFSDLTSLLGLPSPEIPPGLDLRLAAASLTYNFTTGMFMVTGDSKTYGKAIFLANQTDGATIYVGGLAMPTVSIELSNLPILDEVLSPGETAKIEGMQVLLSSEAITAQQAAQINAVIPEGYPKVPSTGTGSPFSFAAKVMFGGTVIPIALGVLNPSQGGESTAGNTIVGPQQGTDLGSVTTTPPPKSDGTTWFNIQKTFGAVTFEKIGFRYSDSVLWVALNASLKVSGLTIDLVGASIGTPITTFDPQFALQGLGIDYRNPPLEIGGGFAKAPPAPGVTFQYDGTVVVKMPAWGLAAFGSYADLEGTPSMFIFAQLSGAFGGPPAFFVTGILGGFGYNSSVRLPSQDEIYTFPFVAGLSNPAVVGGPNATPMEALTAITGGPNPWVTHSLGDNWIAAGLSFTTYELFFSTGLFFVQFGNDLTIALLGMSTAKFPPTGPMRPYAQIQLQLEAILQPGLGFFGIAANLTKNSYVLDPSCVLTGGFAFYLWFSPNEHAGDFVITLGGYNPNFNKPAHYPNEPRVGFSWSMDSTISINGGAYFALTPSAIMAGGSLGVTFHDGNLQAWFTAHADMIIWFKPFHFLVNIGVTVGASYKMELLFTSVTLKVELGADLVLWGPPTGGIVNVYWWVISFTIDFGSPFTSQPGPLQTWDEFASLLPAAPDVVKMVPLTGQLAQQTVNAAAMQARRRAALGDAPNGHVDPWLVRNNGFSFVTTSSIPASQLFVGSTSQTPMKSGDPLNIRPMAKTNLVSQQRIVIRLDGAEIDYTGWTFDTPTAAVAKALWGLDNDGKLDDTQLIPNQLTGFLVTAPPPDLGPTAGPIDVAQNLSFDPLSPDGITPTFQGPTGDVAVDGVNTIAIIESEIATTAKPARDQLFADLLALGVDPGANDPLDAYARIAGNLFIGEPLLVPAA